jgi:squalene-hopene/tetraprenyl-beta-curcumene cyclase
MSDPSAAIPAPNDAEFSRALDETIELAGAELGAGQAGDGHWSYQLEADATIPAEYVILNHFLDEIDDPTEQKLARYLRRIQGPDGGWPLFAAGEANISASVKAYLALKLVGDDIDAPHMQRARAKILELGGLPACNVFTRICLAFFDLIPWSALPVMRVEIMFAPRWFPMHIDKVSYWSRTVMVPLLVLVAKRARAKNPRKIRLDELMPANPFDRQFKLHNPTGHWLGTALIAADKIARPLEHLIPRFVTDKAIARAMSFVDERLNGEDGLGGIFPAMANALMAYRVLGLAADDPKVLIARKAIDKLLIFQGDEAYCQPCLSPVWDTGLASLAMLESARGDVPAAVEKACDWLVDRQVTNVVGDWRARRADIAPGGWAFQYRNDYYPDVDDTAVVVMALHRAGEKRYQKAIARATDWILGMQSTNGGWGAFDAENEHYALNNIPFADHGALLDPPTADVTARCLGMLVQLGYDRSHPAVRRAIEFLKREQEADGSWFGRWGTNYVYGTWSVLSALNAAGENLEQPYIQRAADWLESRQQADGGWGESCASYWEETRDVASPPLSSQTSWAVLALMAAGRTDSDAVRRGIAYLLRTKKEAGGWQENLYNAVGFARVFYLKYHGYAKYFPLLALSRYRNLTLSNSKRTAYGL